ncbi:MAG: LysR family transcriptional regulator, partial [Pseudomonadota bacterium]
MNLRFLETLVTVADTGGFTPAAAASNRTLSAVSMQMKMLERDLDAELFDRTRRPPSLTPLGRRVADQARDVLK